MSLPPKVAAVLEALEKAGHEAFIVGGCVRDMLLGKAPEDFDVATSAKPRHVKALFGRTVDTGIRHGTVTVLLGNETGRTDKTDKIEVTTYRVDGEYLDKRRPSWVGFTERIDEDLARRDFTMNAIAYNPKSGWRDPFGGRRDIGNRLIKCVGEPHERFSEDALRMVRAARFAGQLGFAVDGGVMRGIAAMRENLGRVSIERISDELRKLLLGEHAGALAIAHEAGLWPHILRGGGIVQGGGADISAAAKSISECARDFPMRLALLLGICANPLEALKNLRLSRKTEKTALAYLAHMRRPPAADKYEIKKLLASLPEGIFGGLLELWRVLLPGGVPERLWRAWREIEDGGECYSLKTLAIDGNRLLAMGALQGRETGRVLAELLDMVMREPGLNEETALMEMAGRLL